MLCGETGDRPFLQFTSPGLELQSTTELQLHSPHGQVHGDGPPGGCRGMACILRYREVKQHAEGHTALIIPASIPLRILKIEGMPPAPFGSTQFQKPLLPHTPFSRRPGWSRCS